MIRFGMRKSRLSSTSRGNTIDFGYALTDEPKVFRIRSLSASVRLSSRANFQGETFMLRKLKPLPLLVVGYLVMFSGSVGQTPNSESARATGNKVESRSTVERDASLSSARHEGTGSTAKPKSPNLATEPTLYVVGYAHLDTQWRWEYPQVIREYLPKTLHDNFALFEKYPHYIFNFSGSNRYRMIKEYWPADYAKLKEYVAAGRWFPAGSSMEEGDVNSPSAESIIRQILYGTQYFRHEFGKTSAEYMLPDCFGFPASLPSILAHMGLKGFSTQKLTWGSAAEVGGDDSPEKTPIGIPFNVGFWEGPDGRGVVAAMNPGTYNGQVREDLSKSPVRTDPTARNPPVDWPKRVQLNGQVSGLFTDYHYYGTVYTGGSPREESVRMMEAIVTKGTAVLPSVQNTQGGQPLQNATAKEAEVRLGDGPLNVISAT